MNSSKGILDKINDDTQIVIDEIIAEAKAKAESIIAKAENQNHELIQECESSLARTYAEIIARTETVARLDAKKIVMKAKKQAMDDIFASAKLAIMQLPDKEYLSIIEKMIICNAVNGDKVIPSGQDKKRVDAKFVKSIATKNNLEITLSDKVGYFVGGVVLEGINFDKNLTLDAELEGLRNEVETEYANKVFEE